MITLLDQSHAFAVRDRSREKPVKDFGQRKSDKVALSTFQKHHVTNSCTIPVPDFAKSDCYSNAGVALYRSNMLLVAEHGDKH